MIGLLGEAADEASVSSLVRRSRAPQGITAAFDDGQSFWQSLLGTVQVTTPDRAMDLMLNRWLLYQTARLPHLGTLGVLSVERRIRLPGSAAGRAGAPVAAPHLARNHIIHAASRQFVEGDVQHWWHEPGGQGVRTKFSDDRLWLVYATLHYMAATGDTGILDENVPFLEGRVLNPEEHEAYERPTVVSRSLRRSTSTASARIAVNLATGAHGLPLMGSGDWNDGMSLVGAGGKGESVWLGWFLLSILRPVRRHRRGPRQCGSGRPRIARTRRRSRARSTVRGTANGTAVPTSTMGRRWDRRRTRSAASTRSRSRGRSLSGGGDPARARQAMESAERHLVRRNDRLILLLTPPFDKMTPEPGLHPGLRAGRARERRPVHPCGALDDHGVRAPGRRRPGGRTLLDAQSDQPHAHADEIAALPGGAVRRRRRCLLAAAAYRTRRMDLVHRLGGWMYRVGVGAILG